MKTAGIYIHIPFCKNKCNYCDYYCLEKQENNMYVFVEMLQREIELIGGEHSQGWLFDTIYFGGGSPALLSPIELKNIVNQLKNQFNTANHIEVTLEVNPSETTGNNLLSFKNSGANRLSIGFQSLDSTLLHILSRTHNPIDCFSIYSEVRDVGFENVSIDMLYSIPGQTVPSWLKDLKTVINLKPDHIAIYPLTIKEGTPLFQQMETRKIYPVDEETELNMFIQGSQYLVENGFNQYEVAHFATPGKECRHNQHYWNLEPCLAFGPSAHGYDGIKRSWNISSLENYISKLSKYEKPVDGFEMLNENQRLNEKIIWGLRTTIGIQKDLLKGLEPKLNLDKNLIKWENYLDISNEAIRIKSGHYHLADEIASDMMLAD